MTDLQVEPEICKPTIAANNFEADTAWPELPAEVVESIASWRRTVGNARSEFAPDILGNAATDLFRTRKIIRTRYPDSDAIVNQEIVDALYDMAETARIDADEAQAIFARAAHTSDAGPAVRNLPVAYPLQAFDNVRLNTACRNYLVKGLLPNSGLAVIWGPPKCGKSFWAFDLGMHVALGRDYRGHRVQQAPVVYIALEGRHGFPARVEAFRRHHGVEVAPFYLLSASLDLVAKSGRLIAAIKAQLGENLPRAIFLDTLNRSLVGSESKDEDMARFLAAAEKVAQELNCVVVIVHHCGIDASRPRGHTGLSGAVESQGADDSCSDHRSFPTLQ